MSKYYNINGLKIRISDHQPNIRLRGSCDVYLYIKDACNQLLSIEDQIRSFCDKQEYDISYFKDIINDWADNSYDIHAFEIKEEEVSEDYCSMLSEELINMERDNNDEKLQGHHLSRFAKHHEIKYLSELTGVSQSYIKKYFNIV